MKPWQKTLLLVLLGVLNLLLIQQIPIAKIEWNKLFPQEQIRTQQSLLQDKQYVLCHLEKKERIQSIKNSPLFESVVALPNKKGVYLCLFDTHKKKRVLDYLQGIKKSGTLMVEEMLFNDFSQEIRLFSTHILPFTLLFLLLFIPLRLWVDILLEMFIYSLLLGLFLRLGFFEVNVASLLALLFLFIYSLTLINYLYSENMDVKRLSFGIGVSIVATMLSALFLINSQFGLLHYFGVMLFVGLIVLYLYINMRLFIFKYLPHEAHRHNFDVTNVSQYSAKRSTLLWLLGFVFLIMGVAGYKNLSVDLNILNILNKETAHFKEIEEFEKRCVPSLLVGIEVTSKESSFHDIAEVRKLIVLQKNLQKTLNAEILLSIPTAYEVFKSMAIDKENPNILAQFLLANSFAHRDIDLFSDDMSSAYFIASLPLRTSSDTIITTKEKIALLNKKYQNFHITLRGKVADFDHFLEIFFKESAIGLLVTLFVSVLFFLLYCKNLLSILIVFISVVFSLASLLLLHTLFGIALSITTLMSLILYGGLVADSFIQLFICYKSRSLSCEKSVLNPIFVSNISILAFLVAMVFVGGILGAFAFDMSILLGANLLFIVVFVPLIYKKFNGSER